MNPPGRRPAKWPASTHGVVNIAAKSRRGAPVGRGGHLFTVYRVLEERETVPRFAGFSPHPIRTNSPSVRRSVLSSRDALFALPGRNKDSLILLFEFRAWCAPLFVSRVRRIRAFVAGQAATALLD